MSMLNVLVLQTEDSTGYGRSGMECALAMDSVGINVACRRIKLNEGTHEIPDRIVELSKKSVENPSEWILLQNIVPYLYDYNGEFRRNILYFSAETENLSPIWLRWLKTANEVWVPNASSKRNLDKTFKKDFSKVVPFATNTEKYKIKPQELGDIGKLKVDNPDLFVFYTVGEFVSRKNYEGLLKSYLGEFTNKDNVLLVLKTSISGQPPEFVGQRVIELINHVKNGLKLKSYPEILVLPEHYTNAELDRLHTECDCFVSASHGEAFNYGLCDALGFGKLMVVSSVGGHKAVLNNNMACLIEGTMERCYGAEDFSGDLYTGRENWFGVDINRFSAEMREVTKMTPGLISNYHRRTGKLIEKLSYKSIGEKIKKTLEESLNI